MLDNAQSSVAWKFPLIEACPGIEMLEEGAVEAYVNRHIEISGGDKGLLELHLRDFQRMHDGFGEPEDGMDGSARNYFACWGKRDFAKAISMLRAELEKIQSGAQIETIDAVFCETTGGVNGVLR